MGIYASPDNWRTCPILSSFILQTYPSSSSPCFLIVSTTGFYCLFRVIRLPAPGIFIWGSGVHFQATVGFAEVCTLLKVFKMCSGLYVREWVSLWVVPETLWTQYLKSQWRKCHQILVAGVLWFTDMLTRFWGQKVKGQGHSRRRHNRPRQPVKLNLVVIASCLTIFWLTIDRADWPTEFSSYT